MSGPFSDVWNAAYESIPSDGENVSQGANRIRATKVAIRERVNIDHSLLGDANDGYHKWITLLQNTADPALPSPVAGTLAASFYAKVVSNHLELFFRNDTGTVQQLTTGGALNVPAPSIPAGTKMLFAQATSPTGWTQDTTNNDRVLRVVNNNVGGTTGGSWTISGIIDNPHALTVAEMPAHTHGIPEIGSNAGAGGAPVATNNGARTSTMQSDSIGGGGTHQHGITADGAWRPAYLNVMVATKN